MALSGTPIFLQWDANTRNTPYKAGLTTHENGFAFCFGEYSGWQTVLVFVQGGDKAYIHFCDGGTPSGWKTWNIE